METLLASMIYDIQLLYDMYRRQTNVVLLYINYFQSTIKILQVNIFQNFLLSLSIFVNNSKDLMTKQSYTILYNLLAEN